jgi:hypothetical protein
MTDHGTEGEHLVNARRRTMREKNCPECRWVFVLDAAGNRRLEMRWQSPVVAPQAQIVAAQAQVARAA